MSTGVSAHAESGVSLYENLVYGKPKVRNRLMGHLYEELKSSPLGEKKSWDIIDIGIGGGWLAQSLIEHVLRDSSSVPETINLVGVDTSKAMLLRLLSSIENMHGGVLSADQQKVRAFKESAAGAGLSAARPSFSFNSRSGKTSVSITLVNRDFLEYASELSSYQFDICLIFFFFHHLGEAWHEGLAKVADILHADDGIVVLSEIGGDHACWSSSFEDIYAIEHLLTDVQRRKYLEFVKKCLTLLKEEYGARRPSQDVSAANVGPAVKALRELGFNTTPRKPAISEEYERQIRTEDWLRAGGLRQGFSRTFSVFPTLSPDKKRELLGRLEEIAQNLDLDLHDQVNVKDRIKLYILQRSTS